MGISAHRAGMAATMAGEAVTSWLAVQAMDAWQRRGMAARKQHQQ
jgi:hypothetical protein